MFAGIVQVANARSMSSIPYEDVHFDFSDSDSDSDLDSDDDKQTAMEKIEKEMGPQPKARPSKKAVMSGRDVRQKARNDAEMKRLTEERFGYLRRIELDRRKGTEVGNRIRSLRDKIQQRHLRLGSYSELYLKNKRARTQRTGAAKAAEMNRYILKREIERLRQQAAEAMAKYNKALAVNQTVREKVNDIRRERRIFEDLFERMEGELEEKRREVEHNTAVTERCYKERDAAQTDMADLKAEMDTAAKEIHSEFAVLNRIIKAGDNVIEATKVAAKHGLVEHRRGDMSLDEERELKRSVKRGMWAIGKDKAMLRTNKSKAKAYRKQWAKIVKQTGVDDFKQLVYAFKSFEDKKYSKVANSSSLVSEIETLELALKKLQDEWDRHREEEEARLGNKHRAVVQLENHVEATEAAVVEARAKASSHIASLEALLEPLLRCFQKIGCEKMLNAPDEGDIPAIFRNPTLRSNVRGGITVHNAPQFMGVVEARAAEILQRYSIFRGGDVDPAKTGGTIGTHGSRGSTLAIGPSEPSGGLRQHIQASVLRLASIADAEDDPAFDGDRARPLTREQLRANARKILGRSSQMAAGSASTAAVQALAATGVGIAGTIRRRPSV